MNTQLALLSDPAKEIVRTSEKLRAQLAASVVMQVEQHAVRKASIVGANLVGAIDAALAIVKREAVDHADRTDLTPQAQMARMQAVVAAIDPRRLAGALLEAPASAVFGSYNTLLTGVCGQDLRLAVLRQHVALPAEGASVIGRAIVAPLEPASAALHEHARRVKEALDTLQPGVTDFAIGMMVTMGVSAFAHALGLGLLTTIFTRRAVRKRFALQRRMTRFAAFLDTAEASLVELRAAVVSAVPAVQQRVHAASLALHGGFLACAQLQLQGTRAAIASVDLERGRVGLWLHQDAGGVLATFAHSAVVQVKAAMAKGEWAKATTMVDEALAAFAPFSERWSVKYRAEPAVAVLNRLRAQVLVSAANVAARRGPAYKARVLLDLMARAPFFWSSGDGVPSPAEIGRELLALEAVVETGKARDVARRALPILASRTTNAQDYGLPPVPMSDKDKALVKFLSEGVLPDASSPADRKLRPWDSLARDLSRRAVAAGAPLGPTTVALRRLGRQRLVRIVGACAATVAVACGGVLLWTTWQTQSATQNQTQAATEAESTEAVVATTPSVVAPAPSHSASAASRSHGALHASHGGRRGTGSSPGTSTVTTLATTGMTGAGMPVLVTQKPVVFPTATVPAAPAPRTACLHACVAKCSDDPNCERACGEGCPL